MVCEGVWYVRVCGMCVCVWVCGVWCGVWGHGAWVVREDARHLRVLVEVGEERPRVLLGEAQVRVADELRPTEAVRAVGVARLAGGGEEEHRLRVLVPGCSGAVESDFGPWLRHQGAATPLSPSRACGSPRASGRASAAVGGRSGCEHGLRARALM
jgi:hypothetical protein